MNLKLMNVYGKELKPCSANGMAVTGFVRDGFCSEHNKDSGSHHICLKDIQNESDAKNFCNITNQPDWCRVSSVCHGDSDKLCDKKNWCICEWAFDSFVKEKGCDTFNIDCNATNKLSMEHYKRSSTNHASNCIKKQCNLT
jgi:uncharacterized protein (DUF2237 family)